EGRSFDLRNETLRRVADRTGVEGRIDDRVVSPHLALGDDAVGLEECRARRRRRSGGRAVDLAVGEDRDVALVQRAELLVDDGSVDAGESLVLGMASDVAVPERVLDLAARADQLREARRHDGKT